MFSSRKTGSFFFFDSEAPSIINVGCSSICQSVLNKSCLGFPTASGNLPLTAVFATFLSALFAVKAEVNQTVNLPR